MARPEVISVSMQELDRLKTVQAVDRQFRQLLERYRWNAA